LFFSTTALWSRKPVFEIDRTIADNASIPRWARLLPWTVALTEYLYRKFKNYPWLQCLKIADHCRFWPPLNWLDCQTRQQGTRRGRASWIFHGSADVRPIVIRRLALPNIDLTILRGNINEQSLKNMGGERQHQLAGLVSLPSTKPKR